MHMHGNEKTDGSLGVGSKGKGKALIPRARRANISDRFDTCTSKCVFYTVKANAAQYASHPHETLD